jgi:tight adherence protein C
MNVLALVCAVAGVWLLAVGAARLRPDPVARALSGHPMSQRRRPRSPGDRWMVSLERRLGVGRRPGDLRVLGLDLADHRRRQAGAAACGTLMAALVLYRSPGPVSSMWSIAVVGGSVALVEWDLRRRAGRRRQVLAGQVVELSEFLALGATAGLTVTEAIERSARFVSAPLHKWLQELSADIRSGRSLQEAVTDSADLMGVPAFTRLGQAVLTATERGTPLAQTLVAQAADQRSLAQARELERAGRAEIAMLVPIVFLILPAVVVVAVYPGFVSLTSM